MCRPKRSVNDCESAEDVARDPRILREIGRAMRDLRARRSHEVLEHLGGDVLLCRREPVQRADEVGANDRCRASEGA